LELRKVKKEGVAVIKLGVNERGCEGASSGKVKGFSSFVALLSPLVLNSK